MYIIFMDICCAQAQEKECQDKINDDAKDLEKMTNKQSLLLKKVCKILQFQSKFLHHYSL